MVAKSCRLITDWLLSVSRTTLGIATLSHVHCVIAGAATDVILDCNVNGEHVITWWLWRLLVVGEGAGSAAASYTLHRLLANDWRMLVAVIIHQKVVKWT